MHVWKHVFLALASLPQRIFAEWHMSNGAAFHFGIPKASKIGETRFNEDVEFPFTYAEIVSIYIFASHGPLKNDLEAVKLALDDVRWIYVIADDEGIQLIPID